MAVRVLLILAVFTVLYGCYGCGQASTPVEQQEKRAGVEQAKLPEQTTEVASAKAPSRCEDFPDRAAAQRYLDAHGEGRNLKGIDPDHNGKACDEGAYLFSRRTGPPASASSAASASAYGAVKGTTGEERAEQREGGCRFITYVRSQGMSTREGARLSNEVAGRMSDKLTFGPAYNAALDDMGVPRYPKCDFTR